MGIFGEVPKPDPRADAQRFGYVGTKSNDGGAYEDWVDLSDPNNPLDQNGQPVKPISYNDYQLSKNPWDTSRWLTLNNASAYTGGMPGVTPAFAGGGALTSGLQQIFKAAGLTDDDLLAAIRADREASGDIFTEGTGLGRRAASILNRAGIPISYEQLATLPGWDDSSASNRTEAARHRDDHELDDFLGNALTGLAMTLGPAGLGPAAFLTELGVPAAVAPFAGAVGTGMLSGADLGQALQGAAIGQGIGFGADLAAPVVNDALASLKGSFSLPSEAATQDFNFADADFESPDADPLKRVRGLQLADAGGDLGGLLMPPAVLDPSLTTMPAAVPATDPTFGGALQQVAPGAFAQPGMLTPSMPAAQKETDPTFDGALKETTPGMFEQPPAEPTVTSADLQRYAKIAKTVYDMLGGEEAAHQGAPRRPQPADGETDITPEQEKTYEEEVVRYLGLDTVAMAEAGLVPGSPEYLDYILQQADSVINGLLGDADPDTEDFAALLRGKTTEELQKLNRALYIRGQLGASAGPGQYTDPFTDKKEDVAAPAGKRFNPNVAAYHRGLARSVDELSRMSPQEAKHFLGGMLDRNPDLFHMQASRDAQGLREALSQGQDDELRRRRRGMFGDSGYFQQELEHSNSADLEKMLALLMGNDRTRQSSAVDQLLGL